MTQSNTRGRVTDLRSSYYQPRVYFFVGRLVNANEVKHELTANDTVKY